MRRMRPYGYSLLGFISYERGELADTVRYLTKALERDGSDADALFFRGIALEAAGQGEAAIAAGRRFLEVDPLSPMAGALLNSAHWFVGRPHEGLDAHEHGLLLDAENPKQYVVVSPCTWYVYVLLATVVVWMDREILEVIPGRVENYYGVAVDIGTTTVALYLCNLKNGKVEAADSIMNPQVSYGEDVMSRISYAMQHPVDGLKRMHEAIIAGLNHLIHSVTQSAGITERDIFEMTMVGNTAMHHIFLSINPLHLGLSPFSPAIHHSVDVKARDLGLHLHPAANVHVLPIEAGFVGADNVGVLIAETPYEKRGIGPSHRRGNERGVGSGKQEAPSLLFLRHRPGPGGRPSAIRDAGGTRGH